MNNITHHLANIAVATGALEVADKAVDSQTAKNCIIAVVVYVLQRIVVNLWDRVFPKKNQNTKHVPISKTH